MIFSQRTPFWGMIATGQQTLRPLRAPSQTCIPRHRDHKVSLFVETKLTGSPSAHRAQIHPWPSPSGPIWLQILLFTELFNDWPLW